MVAPATEIRIEPFSSASIVNTLSMLTRMAVLERFWVKLMKVVNVVPSCAFGYVNAVALGEPSASAMRCMVHSSLPYSYSRAVLAAASASIARSSVLA